MSAQIKRLLRDTTQMGNSIRQYQSMLNVNMTEQEKLNALLSQKKTELSERERTINELQNMINAQNDKVQKLLNKQTDIDVFIEGHTLSCKPSANTTQRSW